MNFVTFQDIMIANTKTALIMQAVNTPETPASMYQTARHNIPEDS
jgi:hypothetical protein